MFEPCPKKAGKICPACYISGGLICGLQKGENEIRKMAKRPKKGKKR